MEGLDLELKTLFDKQLAFAPKARNLTVTQRIALLSKLEKAIIARRTRFQEAMYRDFGKPAQEVDLVDLYWVLREIRHIRAHLRSWMRPKRKPTPLAFIGSRSYLTYAPKGVCLILSPWNYPINLTLGPLVGALAAGCTAILKPSEFTPHTSAEMEALVCDLFPESHVAMVSGGVAKSEALLKLPFHHIFFTGSSQVGKIVMRAASEHLTSVTLELGGKCPAVIDRTADLSVTARRVLMTKFVNAGQTCIAPDYLLVDESIHDQLVAQLQKTLEAFFPTPETYEKDYSGIVHEAHLQRVHDLVEDAVHAGGRIVSGGERIAGTNKYLPTILTHVNPQARVLQEEIFAPVLPVVSYRTTQDAIDYINSHPRPLGLYVFGKKSAAQKILSNTHSGGSCINHCALNFYNPDLPFGGVNASGIGKSHGFASFEAFSNAHGVYRQIWKSTPSDLLHAPYTRTKQWLIDLVVKWL